MATQSTKKSGKIKISTTATHTKQGVEAVVEHDDVIPAPALKKGEALAWVSSGFSSKITKRGSFLSIGIEIAVDFPFAVKPGDTDVIPSLIQQVTDQVDKAIPGRLEEAEQALDDLIKELAKK